MLNINQQKAVDVRNANILVSASAGSGKTKVLITRIANMIVNGETDISKLLVVTFTKASATEMKQRLIAELGNIRENTKDEQLKQRLLNQIEEISLSDISTIHSFCAKVVRKYFYELELDPSFKLVEDGLFDLKEKAINNVINYYLNNKDEEFEKMYYAFNQKRSNLQLIQTIFLICEILHKNNNSITQLKFEDINNNPAMQYISNYITKTANLLLSKIQDYVKNIVISEDKFTQHLSTVISYLHSLKNQPFSIQFNLINQCAFPKNYLKDNKEEYAYIVTLVKNHINDVVKGLLEKCETADEIQNNINQSEWITNKLIDVTYKYMAEFYKLKQEKSILDLSDIENLTIKLLENKQIKQELQQSYDYIFIDEYQDTNQIQETILTSIAKENNMFMVGDIKQSIYGFRLCDPTIFCDKYALFEYVGKNQKIDLNKNYRSNKNILDFTNMVCSKIITEDIGKVDYLNNSMLETEINIYPVNNIPSVQVFAIKKQKEKKQQVDLLNCQPYSVKEAQTNQDNENMLLKTEAKIIANQIASIVGNTLKIEKDGVITEKTINYSDLCILSRNKKGYMQKLSALLSQYEIPVSVVYNDNVYEYFEVKTLINALKTINNMYDDISLTSTLTNLYYFTLNELVEIREKHNHKFFYECLLNFKKDDNFELYNKIKNFLTSINNFKIKSSYLSVFEIINLVIEESNYITMLNCLNQSKEKIANVNIFINLIKSQNIQSINQFINNLNNPFNKTGKDISINNGENSVKLDSIHSSKGLEFPVVILTNCGKDITIDISKDLIYYNKNIGLSCSSYEVENRHKYNSVMQNIIKFANRFEKFEEDLRLLYVALTRAKNNLIVVGGFQPENINTIKNSLDITECKTYLQLILGSFDNTVISKINQQNFIEVDGNIKINILDTEIINKNQKLKQNFKFESQTLSENQKSLIDYIFNFKYPYQKSTTLAVKSSVSELNSTDEQLTSYNFTPKNLTINENNYSLTADKIGTAYHTVMQYIKFDLKDNNQIESYINELVADNKLTIEEKQCIDIDSIQKCLQEINQLITDKSVIKKEQKFIMLQKHCELVENSDLTDEVLVQGIIDLIIDNGDEVFVIDYKTTKASPEKLIQIYKKQLFLYAKATSISLNKTNIKHIIYSFYHNKFIEIN